MIKNLLKLLAFYLVVFGTIGILIQLNDGLSDYRNHGQFFLRTTPGEFVAAFFVLPLFGLLSFIVSLIKMRVFAPDVLEVHLMIVLFFGFAIFGFLKGSRFILLVAALVPICWAILDLDLIRYIQVK